MYLQLPLPIILYGLSFMAGLEKDNDFQGGNKATSLHKIELRGPDVASQKCKIKPTSESP